FYASACHLTEWCLTSGAVPDWMVHECLTSGAVPDWMVHECLTSGAVSDWMVHECLTSGAVPFPVSYHFQKETVFGAAKCCWHQTIEIETLFQPTKEL
ncbi:hypothetical protein HispidOSU_012493, partial [Sigmodon hispidus]